MRPGQPDEAPGPWHDPVGVVAAAAGRQPAAARVAMRDVVHQSRGLAHGGRGHEQVRERVPGVRVSSVLRHDDVRPERGGQLGEQPAHGRQPRPLAGSRFERHVDRRPGRHPLPQLPHPARAREQVPPALVERQRQDARIVRVDRLDPVAVVDIEVHVQDAKPVPARPGDGQRRVVVDAEARRAVRHRVVEAATRVECMLGIAVEDRLDGPQRATGHGGRGLVHPGERRIVAALTDAGLREAERIDREPLHGLEIAPACGTTGAPRRAPAPARGRARRRPRAGGRSPARTVAA